MNIEKDKTVLSGISTNPQHLQAFYKRLKKKENLKLMELTDINVVLKDMNLL